MQEIKLNNNETVQTKIFYGYSFSVESQSNIWLKENNDKTIIDIKFSTDNNHLYLIVIYKYNL